MKRSVLLAGSICVLLLVGGINAECKLGCKTSVCVRNGAGQCWKAHPGSCFNGWWRSGGQEGSFVCDNKFPAEWFVKHICPDCSPRCPQIANVEALHCGPTADCQSYPNPNTYDGMWRVKECVPITPTDDDGGIV